MNQLATISQRLFLRVRSRIQKIIGTHSKGALTSSSLIALCDQAVVSSTSFVTAAMIGRECGKAELGVYSLAWTVITISTGLLSTLVGSPYTVFGPTLRPSRRRLYLGSILVHQLLLSFSVCLGVCCLIAAGHWYGSVSEDIASIGIATASVVVFVSLREFIRTVSFTELRVGWALSVDISYALAQTGAMLLLIHWRALTVFRTCAIVAVSSALAASGWLLLHRASFRFDRRFYLADLRRNWNFGKWVLGSGLLWQASGYLFPWLLAAFHGKAVTGLWAACSAIVALGNPVLLGLSNYALPKISNVYARSGVLHMKHQVHSYSLVFAVLLLPVVFAVWGFGEQLLALVYGEGYQRTTSILTLLGLNLLVVTVAKPFAQGLFCLNHARADTFVNLVWVGMMIVVGLPVIRTYGALGAAATMLASASIAVAVKISVFTKAAQAHQHNLPSLKSALSVMPSGLDANLPE